MIREQLEKERLAKMEAALRAKRQREEVAAAAAGAATPRSPPKDARFPFLGFASGSVSLRLFSFVNFAISCMTVLLL